LWLETRVGPAGEEVGVHGYDAGGFGVLGIGGFEVNGVEAGVSLAGVGGFDVFLRGSLYAGVSRL
jgi:hypothetical protein